MVYDDYVLKVSIEGFVKDINTFDKGIVLLKDKGLEVSCVEYERYSQKEEAERKEARDKERFEEEIKDQVIQDELNKKISKEYNNVLDYFKLLKKEGNMPDELFLNLKSSLDYLNFGKICDGENPF